MGHRQQRRTRPDPQIAASDQVLHCLLTENSIRIPIKMKNTTQQPLKGKWTCPFDKGGKIHLAYYAVSTVHF